MGKKTDVSVVKLVASIPFEEGRYPSRPTGGETSGSSMMQTCLPMLGRVSRQKLVTDTIMQMMEMMANTLASFELSGSSQKSQT